MPLPAGPAWMAGLRGTLASAGLAPSSPTTSLTGTPFDAHEALFQPALQLIGAAVTASLVGGQWVLGAAPPAAPPGTTTYVSPLAAPAAAARAQAQAQAVPLAAAAGLAGEAGIKLPIAVWQALTDGYAQATLLITAAELTPAASAAYGLVPLPLNRPALISGLMALWASDPRLASPEPQLRSRVAGLLADTASATVAALQISLVHVGLSPVPTPPPPALAAAITTLT